MEEQIKEVENAMGDDGLFASLVATDPEKRLTAKEVIEHPWLQDV